MLFKGEGLLKVGADSAIVQIKPNKLRIPSLWIQT